MKILFTAILAFYGFYLQAQSSYLGFDGSDWGWPPITFSIDTISDSTNIWRVGPPQKNTFTSAYSAPNVIVTDTLLPYPINNHSFFEMDFPIDNWGSPWPYYYLNFQHVMDVDPGEGGWIEASYDLGQTWHNIFSDPNTIVAVEGYNTVSYLANGEIGWQGPSSWQTTTICWINAAGNWWSQNNLIKLRFHFVSDSVQTNKDGWMLDDFNMFGFIIHVTERLMDEGAPTALFPNPSSEYLNVYFHDEAAGKTTISVCSATGQYLYTAHEGYKSSGNFSCTLQRNQLPEQNGIYMLRIEKPSGSVEYQRFVIHH